MHFLSFKEVIWIWWVVLVMWDPQYTYVSWVTVEQRKEARSPASGGLVCFFFPLPFILCLAELRSLVVENTCWGNIDIWKRRGVCHTRIHGGCIVSWVLSNRLQSKAVLWMSWGWSSQWLLLNGLLLGPGFSSLCAAVAGPAIKVWNIFHQLAKSPAVLRFSSVVDL